jgi:hypothetical protein
MLLPFSHAAPSMLRPAVWPCGRVARGRRPCGRQHSSVYAYISMGGGGLGLKTKNYGSRLPSEKRKMTI